MNKFDSIILRGKDFRRSRSAPHQTFSPLFYNSAASPLGNVAALSQAPIGPERGPSAPGVAPTTGTPTRGRSGGLGGGRRARRFNAHGPVLKILATIYRCRLPGCGYASTLWQALLI